MNYVDFLHSLDKYLKQCFELHKDYVYCKKGCSSCCEKGDYPISQTELEYIMQGYIAQDNKTKKIIQDQINKIKKGGACPFLINNQCSIYNYRPIVCRVHGLAYLLKNNTVKVPYCVNEGKNYNSVYKDGTIEISPIAKNLETSSFAKEFNFGEIRNMYDWLK